MSYYLYYEKEDTIKSVKFDDVLSELYEFNAYLPKVEEIKDYIKRGKDSTIKKYLKSKSPKLIKEEIRIDISQIDYKSPLYDTFTNNLYLVSKENIYDRVIYKNYRFPDDDLLDTLDETLDKLKEELKKEETPNGKLNDKDIKRRREMYKIHRIFLFMGNFDLNVLMETYINSFYYYANQVGKDITTCIRPSFLPHFKHITPYYRRTELINLALNIGIIKPSSKYYDSEEVLKLCKQVKKNDVKSSTILKHQNYIANNDKVGLIQYYSFQGSYFMNQYLRGLINYDYRNDLLEKLIKSMWQLTLNSPAFDKSYILYRFVSDDSYLKHLEIGDIFINPSFISTTRDPFYRPKEYKFGFILIKIKIRKCVKGVGLCIEPFSHFPEEQEIILPPKTKLKLDKKDSNSHYYHIDHRYASQIVTRYEFSYVEHGDIELPDRPVLIDKGEVINFLEIYVPEVGTIYERIDYFIYNYVNEIYQFRTLIGDKYYDLIIESYDSTGAYKNLYGVTTNNGFSIYTFEDNYILFFIELGEIENESYMYVNYYFRHALSNKKNTINDKDFTDFISKVAYYFGVSNVILYTEYSSCNLREVSSETNYNIDFYKYLKYGKKRYVKIGRELKAAFSYYELDRLKKIDPLKIINNEDRDEIYQIYKYFYKRSIKNKSKLNLADFYCWVVENNCVSIKDLVEQMTRVYNINNPFKNDYYVLYAMQYLYNNNLINEIPTFETDTVVKPKIDRYPKNIYRIEQTLRIKKR